MSTPHLFWLSSLIGQTQSIVVASLAVDTCTNCSQPYEDEPFRDHIGSGSGGALSLVLIILLPYGEDFW